MQREVKFLGVNPMSLTAGAVEPLLCSSWRFGFNDFGKPDGPLYFGLSDSGPLVAMAAVEPTIAALRGENKVLRDLLRAADNVLDTVDEDSDASAEGLEALRASIAYALTHSLPEAAA